MKLNQRKTPVKRLYRYTFILATGWTILVLGLLLVDIFHIKDQTLALAINTARAHFNTSQAIRFWASSHGGVYVPVSENTPPNPYLSHIPERDITTPSGRPLTLMNPAYMLRHMNENFGDLFGIKGHLTSLNLLRPENAPDEWERKALNAFEQGKKEILETTQIGQDPYLRLMQPLFIEEGCLKCHGHQGFKVGDVRGGISVSVPMKSYLRREFKEISLQAVSHGFFWVLGMAGLFLGTRSLRSHILEQEKAEEELTLSHERLLTVLDSLDAFVYVTDMESYHVLFANKRIREMFGETEGKVCWRVLQTNQTGPCDFCKKDKLISPDGQPLGAYTWEFHSRPQNRWYHVSDRAIRWVDDRIVKLGIATDITERKQNEEQLLRLATAIEQSGEPIVVTDLDAHIQYVNPAFERITGYTREEVLGQNPRLLKGGKQDEKFYENLWKTIIRGEVWTGRFVNRKKNGELFEEDATISPIKDPSGNIKGYVAVKRDVTREVRLEKQIRQSQKLEAVGTLAGGIAHDFNNILTGIIGYCQFAQEEVVPETQAFQDLEQALTGCKRARELVNQILTFSRQTDQELQPIQMNSIIKESLKLLRASIPTTIEIKEDIQEDAGTVLADPTQMTQVVMNLCTNAEYSMREKGGILGITLQSIEVDKESAASNANLHEGPYVLLTVSDTGDGMDKDTQARVFEPFFTTKKKGEGTGLGLSTLHGIVTGHGGAVTVYSEPGRGSTFKVYFPRIIRMAKEQKFSHVTLSGGHERIMVVDDEELLALLGKRRLEGLGYEVAAFTSSEEALRVFKEDPRKFDLVITDQTMPNMTGEKLAEKLLRIRPDLPIILCTGFSHSITPEKAKTMGIRGFIMKPVILQDLAKAVRQALKEDEK